MYTTRFAHGLNCLSFYGLECVFAIVYARQAIEVLQGFRSNGHNELITIVLLSCLRCVDARCHLLALLDFALPRQIWQAGVVAKQPGEFPLITFGKRALTQTEETLT
jgi:hypothetical protein